MSRRSRITAGSILGLALALGTGSKSQAAELRILAGGALAGPMAEIAPAFERSSGHKLAIEFGATPQLIKLATAPAPFDLGVVPVDVMKDAAARARFAAGPTTDIARVGFGVAVRAGAAKPDVGSPEALKRTLLAAPSIAMLPESAAGAYVLKVFERLGVTDEMKARMKVQSTPGEIPAAVARGDAELGIFLTNVLMAPGVELAGFFPAELQQQLVFTAALSTDTPRAEAAKAFIDYLRSPAGAAVFKAKGMTAG
jgi:molybdate transport system substrate-binding protein